VEFFGITCDHWVHDSSKTNYLTVTAQYFNNKELKSRVLCTIETEDKKAATTKYMVDEILHSFAIQNSELIYVTDNASAMKLAFTNEIWMGCSSHNMNLVQKHAFDKINVDKDLKLINDLLIHSKELVTLAKRSGYV